MRQAITPSRIRQISPFAIVNKGFFWPTRHSNPVSLTRVEVAVQVYKKYRKIARASEILGTQFYHTKKLLRSFEPTIFQTHPVRRGGRPALLRTSLTKTELEFAKKYYGRMKLVDIAAHLGIWTARLEYMLWKAGVYRPGESGVTAPPLRGDAPGDWPKSWQREYIETEMKRKNAQFEHVVDDLFPKKESHVLDEEDEIHDLLREYGIE